MRGVMISRTRRSSTLRIPASMSRSEASIRPPAALARYSPASSSGEWTCAWLWSTCRFHQPHQLERRAVEQRDERAEQPLADLHRRQGRHRQPLRVAQRHGLGEQLAEHHLHRGDGHQHDEHRDRSTTDAAQRRLEQRGELRLAVGAGNEAAERDADLARRDVGVEALGVGRIASRRSASRLPAAASSCTRERRDPTVANSAAT
jgi:hypothetical protein